MPVYVDPGQVERVLKAFGKAKVKDARNIRSALEQAAYMILTRSQKYVPVDTGNLKRSGRVIVEDTEGLGAQTAVLYEAPYAIYVHERVDIAHAAPTQAKYLERAVRELKGSITALVQRQVQVGAN